MPRYVIERELPGGASKLSQQDLQGISPKIMWCTG